MPRKEGDRYFYLRNDGSQNQSVLHVAQSLEAPGRVLLDPNVLRGDATVALARYVPSPDGMLVAYALSDAGTDWEIWRFRDVNSGVDLPDELRFTKFWNFSWARDSHGAYYSRYPRSKSPGVNDKGDDKAQPAIYFHRIGTAQRADRLIYAIRDHATRVPSAEVTEDGRYLIVSLNDGYAANAVRVLDLHRARAKPVELFGGWDALYTVIGSEDDTFYVLTTQGAPRGRVIAVNVRAPQPTDWRTIVAESDMTLTAASYVGGRIITNYIRDACGVARLYTTQGQLIGDVPLPGLGTVEGFGGHGRDSEAFFSFADYLQPPQIFRYDVANNMTSAFKRAAPAVDTSRFATEQFFFNSRDGTLPVDFAALQAMARSAAKAAPGNAWSAIRGRSQYTGLMAKWQMRDGLFVFDHAQAESNGLLATLQGQVGTATNELDLIVRVTPATADSATRAGSPRLRSPLSRSLGTIRDTVAIHGSKDQPTFLPLDIDRAP